MLLFGDAVVDPIDNFKESPWQILVCQGSYFFSERISEPIMYFFSIKTNLLSKGTFVILSCIH